MLGRPTRKRTKIDGVNYDVNLTYWGTTGLVNRLRYPISTNGERFEIQHVYANGLLKRVKEFQGSTIYWEAVSTDAWGHFQDESFGNGVDTFTEFDQASGLMSYREGGIGGGTGLIHSLVDWDLNGNLKQRIDNKLPSPVTEDFYYDALDRFDYSQRNGTTNADVTLDAIGNISWKMGVGNYSYHATKKRAVVSAGSNSYGYDANGNMTSRNGASISYTSYNLPSVINAGTGFSSTLSYGAFRNRYKQVAVTPSTGTETTVYVAGLWEKVTRGGLIEYRHYIGGGQGTAAIHTRRAGSQTNSDTIYVHRDHLGSPELITDSAGNEIVRPSFGAYGERRDGTDWDGPPSAADLTAIGNTSRRGFTGHEHLDAVGLIHMNGRVYEPVVGRFLGVDPILGVGNSQDVSSYSDAWNSPLNVIDPSGLQDKDVTVHQCISCDSIPYYSGGMGSFFAFMDSMGWLDFRGPTIEETRSWVLFKPGDAVDAIPQNAVSDGKSFGGPAVLFGVGSARYSAAANRDPRRGMQGRERFTESDVEAILDEIRLAVKGLVGVQSRSVGEVAQELNDALGPISMKWDIEIGVRIFCTGRRGCRVSWVSAPTTDYKNWTVPSLDFVKPPNGAYRLAAEWHSHADWEHLSPNTRTVFSGSDVERAKERWNRKPSYVTQRFGLYMYHPLTDLACHIQTGACTRPYAPTQ